MTKVLAILALAAAGLVVPTNVGAMLGFGFFALTLVVLPAPQRVGWFGFGVSTLLLGTVLYALAVPDPPSWTLGPFRLGEGGAARGALEMSRAVGLFSLGAVAAHWIPARDVLPWITRRPLPFYVAGSLVRLVPTLYDDLERIRLAQEARGHEFRATWFRPAGYLPLLVPLFVSTLRRAREQAVALQLAGLSPRRRTP